MDRVHPSAHDAKYDQPRVQGIGDNSAENEDAQAGVQSVQAIASSWSPASLIVAYVLIWIVYFVMLLQQGTGAALTPYVTSSFQSHSLTPTVNVLGSVIGGVCNLTVAKVLDVFGRPQGYALSLLLVTVGLVMMAATRNVEMYAAAQVFWTVGNTSLLYTVGIFIADTTALHNRGLMTALSASPNIVTIWLAGPISEAFLKGRGWQWCFGVFCIIVPVVCLPFLVLLWWYSIKANRERVVPAQSVWYYAREFDAVGLLLLTAGLALFLLPFNLYTLQPLGWRSPLIICLLVFGVVLIALFALWERFFAPVTFIPFAILIDRNMVGACLLGTVLFISYYCWFSFFSSFLQVVNNLSVTHASYVAQIYSLGGSLFGIAAGILIRHTGRYKAITLYGAIPIYALFMGLMAYFRTPDKSIGYIILCQIFLSISGGVIVITPPIAAMSSTTHRHIAAVVAVVSVFSSIGGAIGSTIASAIWQSVFPAKLAEYLPFEDKDNLLSIYTMLDVQLSYPVGTPARVAIQRAYADTQAMILAAGTAIWALGFLAAAMWRDTDVRGLKQVRGRVI